MKASTDEHGAADAATAREEVGSGETSSETSAGTVDAYIGSRLRQAFDAVAQQPVPDRFLQLMAQLDKA